MVGGECGRVLDAGADGEEEEEEGCGGGCVRGEGLE